MALECAQDASALDRVVDLGIARVEVLRKLAFLEHALGRVFEGGLRVVGIEAQAERDRFGKAPRVVGERTRAGGLGRDQRGVTPDRLAVRRQ